METRSEEKFYCACDGSEALRAEYGPFQTREEAEEQARMLGWTWVVCYTHVMVYDKIVDVKTAYYEIEQGRVPLRDATMRDTMKRPDDPRRFMLDIRQQAMQQQQQRKCPSCQEGTCTEHKPDTRLAQKPFDESPVTPMSAADAAFFASLEKQMEKK
jgi:hypothetical protein